MEARRINAVKIQITLKIIPKNLTRKICILDIKFVLTPKNALDNRSIVLRPQKNPNSIPPMCVKLSTNGVRPITIFKIISRTNQIKTLM